jgi:hypothetical protein
MQGKFIMRAVKFEHATVATFSKTSVKKFDMFERKSALADASEFSNFSEVLREESCVVAGGSSKEGGKPSFKKALSFI